MVRTHGQGTIYHGEDAARTAGALWRDGDVFIVGTTGASYVRTAGTWVQISAGTAPTDHGALSGLSDDDHSQYHTDARGDARYIQPGVLTARGDLLTRNATIPERLALTVPSAPTLNFLGVANGETQPGWKSASSAPGAAAAVLQTKATGELQLGAVLQIVGDTFPTSGKGLELGGNEYYSVIESINRDTSTGMPIYFNYGITGDMIFNAGASNGNVQIGDTQNRSTTVSTKAVNIFDGTAPVGTLANGFTLYSSGGAPYVMDAAGTARNLITDYVLASTLDANTVLYAVTDNTPAALSVGASTVVGRKDTGDIVALNASEGRTVLGLGTMATEAAADYIAKTLTSAKGDLIIASAANTPARYGVVAPASPAINVLGVANGEDAPTWKSASSAGAADAHIVQTDAAGVTALRGLIAPYLRPAADSTTALQLQNAAGTAILTVDTANRQIVINSPVGSASTNPYQFRVNDGTTGGYFAVAEAASGASVYLPAFIGRSAGVNGAGFFLYGYMPSANDAAVSGLAAITMEGGKIAVDGTGSALSNAHVMAVTNYGTLLLQVAATGQTTISNGLTVNENGGSAATDDFRVESAGETDMLSLDADGNTTGLLYLGGRTNGLKVAKGGIVSLIGSAIRSPTSSGSGAAGEICWDANYIYICTASNTWKRVALTGGY